MSKNSTNIKRTNVQAAHTVKGPGLHSISTNCNQLMERQWQHLGVSRTTTMTCMSTGHYSAGDQNCNSELHRQCPPVRLAGEQGI